MIQILYGIIFKMLFLAEGRAEVADDQESRESGDLVGDYYPSRLATGQAKPTFYR